LKRINRNKFFTFIGTGFLGIAVFRNFSFGSLTRRLSRTPVKVKTNPLSISRKKRENNA
jgi:hypothetical protein